MIKVGDTLKTLNGAEIKVLFIKDDSYTCEFIDKGFVATWQRDGDRLGYILHDYCAGDYSVDIAPKPVYNGAFGESVEGDSNIVHYIAKQNGNSGRFEMVTCIYSHCGIENVFTTKKACRAYCDALNCLQIDLRKNSVEPLDGVEQWGLKLGIYADLLVARYSDITIKLAFALPWYETKEEAEKHLADSARIIESLKTMKGISK